MIENNTMNEMNQPTTPQKKKGCGCLLNILGGIVALVVALLVAAWVIVMHTSVPLRAVAGMIESGDPDSHIKITGVSGTLSSGLAFKSMKWDDGELGDVRVKYSGIMDVVRRKKLILHEVRVGKALINITETGEEGDETDSPTEHPTSEKSGEPPLKLFQIDRLTLENIMVKNPATGFSLSIPALEWTGFKAEKGNVAFGKLTADSDHLKLATSDAPDPQYQTRVDGTIMPKMHSLIRKPIRFMVDMGMADERMVFHLKAFEEGLEMVKVTDQTCQINVRGVNLADYFDAPLPQSLALEAVLENAGAEENGLLDVRGGEFQLGMRKFEIQPAKVDEPVGEQTVVVLTAVSRDGESELRYEIVQSGTDGTPMQRLSGVPPLGPEDTLATVFYGKRFAALAPADQKVVTSRLSWFSDGKTD